MLTTWPGHAGGVCIKHLRGFAITNVGVLLLVIYNCRSRRAAWIILFLNLVHLFLQCYATIFLAANTPLSLSVAWNGLLQSLFSFASETPFDFFILYAMAVAVEHLVRSAQRKEEEA